MSKLGSNDILPLIHTYLVEIGMQKLAKKLEKEAGFNLENNKQGIAGKKLKKICKFYLKHHPKLQVSVENGLNETESNEPEVNEEEIQDSENEPKTKILKKNAKIEIENDDDENENEKTNEKEEVHDNDDEEEEESETNDKKNHKVDNLDENSKKIAKKNFFQRVDHSRLDELKPELKDNTFLAKFKFGGGDEFGKIGHEKLKDTRGRNFKKEKSKLKNKNFQGGGFKIDIHARNSIKL